MAIPLVRLPELEYPRNALLDFSGVNNALNSYRQSQEFNARHQLDLDRFRQQSETERERLRLERTRTGYEGQRLQLEQDERKRQEREREITRFGNMAASINDIANEDQRRGAWERFVMGTPRLAEALHGNGIDPADFRQGPRYVMSQVQDARTRYQPQILHGGPGQAFFEQRTGPGGQTVMAPVAAVPQRPREMSFNDINSLTDQGQQFGSVSRAIQTFDPRYTSPGVLAALVRLGEWRNWRGRIDPRAPPEVQAAAQWWQDYQMSTELGERNRLFGSALTAPEQRAWEAASITPSMTPAAIQANLERRRQIVEGAIARRTGALVEQGFDPRVIARAYGMQTQGPSQQPPPQPGQMPLPGNDGTMRTLTIGGQQRTFVSRGGQWFEVTQ